MELERTLAQQLSRRTFLGTGAAVTASLVVAACGIVSVEQVDTDDDVPPDDDDDLDDPSAIEEDDEDLDPDDDDVEVDPADDDEDLDPVEDDDDDPEIDDDDDPDDDDVDPDDDDDDDEVDEEEEPDPTEPRVIVGDVVDYTLEPEGRWDGAFGSVTLRLHRGLVDGEEVTFIRTDASDASFASQEGLVHTPLLANALDEPGSVGDLYIFREAPPGQLPVMSASPDDGDAFSSAFQIHFVTVVGKIATPLLSAEEIERVTAGGGAMIERSNIVVNYPIVTWPGGQIPVDSVNAEALGGGQLVEDPDVGGGEVTFKLHPAYPGNRFILTSTSAVELASNLGTAGAGGTGLLIAAGATGPSALFLNGPEGAGAMGYQPGVFNVDAEDPEWSPFREQSSVEWANPDEAEPVTSQEQLDDLIASGDLVQYSGLPVTDPDSFVVNCPVPILAPVTWSPDDTDD